MPLKGKQLLPRDVARLMYDAGWVQVENLLEMICTAYAESNLYTEAYHVNDDGTTDWGYLQLNDAGRTGQALEEFKAMAFNPVLATAHARKMYVDRGFQPWVAHNSGAWVKFIPQGAAGIRNMLLVLHGLQPV